MTKYYVACPLSPRLPIFSTYTLKAERAWGRGYTNAVKVHVLRQLLQIYGIFKSYIFLKYLIYVHSCYSSVGTVAHAFGIIFISIYVVKFMQDSIIIRYLLLICDITFTYSRHNLKFTLILSWPTLYTF